MADSSDDQNLFICPICLHLLNNPVTTFCGHSFCMDCLNEFWDRDNQKGIYSCPQCRQVFTPRPTLSRNTVMAAVVEKMKREAPEAGTASPVLSLSVSGEVECDICTETKLKALKSCLVCLASYCESHIQTHYTSPALKWHKLVNASPHLLDQICSEHHKPLELYCCKDQQLICMQCAVISHQNHNMTSPALERQKLQIQIQENQDGLQKEMDQREMRVQELRNAMESHKCSAEAAVKHCKKMFTDLICSMKKRQAEITQIIRAQENTEVSRVEGLIVTLEQEIRDLKRRHEELGELSQKEDDINVIQNFSSLSRYQCSDLSSISVSQCLTFEETEKIVCELKNQLDDLCEQDIVRISEKVPAVQIMQNSMTNEKIKKYLPSQPKTREEFLIYFTNLSLNSSPGDQLYVDSNKSVSRIDSRMNTYGSYTYEVLCNEILCGRCYFEVQWVGKGCTIALSYDKVCQGRQFIFGSTDRSWKFNFPIADLSVLHNNNYTKVSLVSKIGVFLDQEAGTVSFYNVSDKMTLLHKIQTTFTQPLYVGFSFQDWENSSSVTICNL